jgi:hypothetical protein
MDSRQQFEEWITTTGLDADLSRGNHGCYLNPPTHWLYCAWIASRESVVVELPRKDPLGTGPGDYGDGRPSEEQYIAAHCNAVLAQCQRAIERQGITWK